MTVAERSRPRCVPIWGDLDDVGDWDRWEAPPLEPPLIEEDGLVHALPPWGPHRTISVEPEGSILECLDREALRRKLDPSPACRPIASPPPALRRPPSPPVTHPYLTEERRARIQRATIAALLWNSIEKRQLSLDALGRAADVHGLTPDEVEPLAAAIARQMLPERPSGYIDWRYA